MIFSYIKDKTTQIQSQQLEFKSLKFIDIHLLLQGQPVQTFFTL